MPVINKNTVLDFFEKLAVFEGIDLNHKWKALLFQKIGAEIGIKRADIISTWINRGAIPGHAAAKILKLDIPDKLKVDCRSCVKSKNVGFTIDEHISTGSNLKNIYNYLINLQTDLSKNYPFYISDKVKPIIQSIVDFKSILDSKLFDENPERASNKLSDIYYGDNSSSRIGNIVKEHDQKYQIKIDTNLHKTIIEAVEYLLESEKRTMPVDRKAEAISLLYELYSNTGKTLELGTVKRYLNLLLEDI